RNFISSHQLEGTFGPSYLAGLSGFEVIFRNPSVPWLIPKLQDAKKSGAIVTSQAVWFFENSPAKIIGVTGTKGKGTTSSLIFECLKTKYSKHAFLTGNIGFVQPLDFLDDLTKDDWIVYELSSFQLQDLEVSPHIGVVLMTTSEHLDHHQTVAEYRDAKENIVRFQNDSDFAIINADYEGSYDMREAGKGQKLFISKKTELVTKGCVIDNETIRFKYLSDWEVPDKAEIKQSELQLRGKHNLENVSAAVLASLAAQVAFADIVEAAKNFKGLEHRLEFLGNKNGVSFYNDSISTVPETAIAAIKAFSEPEILILGGSEKNSDFTELGQVIKNASNIKAIIFVGKIGPKIKEAIERAGTFNGKVLDGAKSMPEILEQVKTVAEAGDVVLLSPAAASFHLLTPYTQRGQPVKVPLNATHGEN